MLSIARFSRRTFKNSHQNVLYSAKITPTFPFKNRIFDHFQVTQKIAEKTQTFNRPQNDPSASHSTKNAWLWLFSPPTADLSCLIENYRPLKKGAHTSSTKDRFREYFNSFNVIKTNTLLGQNMWLVRQLSWYTAQLKVLVECVQFWYNIATIYRNFTHFTSTSNWAV